MMIKNNKCKCDRNNRAYICDDGPLFGDLVAIDLVKKIEKNGHI